LKKTIKKLWLMGALGVLASCAAAPHAPPFATRPYEAFSRGNAIAIARTEWQAWGDRVDDDQGAGYVQTEASMAERQPGLWQRVGAYWWQGMPPGAREAGWTGKHDAAGHVFPVAVNGDYAWSAAFISYVMRIAGAGPAFPSAADHAFYINYAARAAAGKLSHPLLIAENPATYAPVAGDLTCFSRGPHLTFADLPTAGSFPAHCAIVVSTAPGTDMVIGGNVDDAVTASHLHTGPDGRLAANADDWFVILRVLYAE
jgi:hypothetical protein